MLKKIALAAACAATMSFADGMAFGGHLAMNMTDWVSDYDGSSAGGMNVGFNAGIAAKIAFSDMVALAPEVTLDMRSVGDDECSFDSWAIDIPVMVRISPIANAYIEVGPQLDLVLSAGWNFDSGNEFADKLAEEIINEIYPDASTIEFSLAFGAGYSVMPNLDVNFRYVMGLTNIFPDAELKDYDGNVIATVELPIQNMQIQVGATYWF